MSATLAALLVGAAVLALLPRDPDGAPRPTRRPVVRRWRDVPLRAAAVPDLAGLMTEVAARLRAGASPPTAWRAALSREAGGEGTLEALARRPVRRSERASLAAQVAAVQAATRLAEAVGAPLAEVLERSAAGVAAAARAEAARRVALAGPASTARLLTALPVAGLVLAPAIGAHPLASVADGGPAAASVGAGALALAAGHAWVRALVRRARAAGLEAPPSRSGRRGPRHPRRATRGRLAPPAPELPVLLDLAAAALEAGAPVPRTLGALAEALGPSPEARALQLAQRRLGGGEEWALAWRDSPGRLAPLADALEPAWTDGVPVSGLLSVAADRLRAERSRRAEEAAARLGVRLVLPLGLCLLPAFVLLAVVPVLVSAGSGLLR